MKVRELPGALALGLLASVLGHAAAYGNAHAMGGPYHGLLITLADAGVGAFVLAAVALAWACAGRCLEGSVLAARLASYLPGVPLLGVATAAWYFFFESIEGSHADDPLLLVALALGLAVVVVHSAARAAIAAVAKFVLAVFTSAFAPRLRVWIARFERPAAVSRLASSRKLFVRPPPRVTACA